MTTFSAIRDIRRDAVRDAVRDVLAASSGFRLQSLNPLQWILSGSPTYDAVLGSPALRNAATGRWQLPVLSGWTINTHFFLEVDGSYSIDFDETEYRPTVTQVRYLSPAGSDANDGLTPATPWQTFSKGVTAGAGTRFICEAGSYANVASWPSEYEIICEDGFAALTGLQHVIPSGATAYYKGVQFDTLVNSTNTSTRFFDGCKFNYLADDATSFDRGVVITRNCTAGAVDGDVLDYGTDTQVLEIENSIHDIAGAAGNDNISTGHNDCRIVRYKCNYSGAPRPIHDVNTCKVYLVECDVDNSTSATLTPYGSFAVGAGQQEAAGEAVEMHVFGGTYGPNAVSSLFVDTDCTLRISNDVTYTSLAGSVDKLSLFSGAAIGSPDLLSELNLNPESDFPASRLVPTSYDPATDNIHALVSPANSAFVRDTGEIAIFDGALPPAEIASLRSAWGLLDVSGSVVDNGTSIVASNAESNPVATSNTASMGGLPTYQKRESSSVSGGTGGRTFLSAIEFVCGGVVDHFVIAGEINGRLQLWRDGARYWQSGEFNLTGAGPHEIACGQMVQAGDKIGLWLSSTSADAGVTRYKDAVLKYAADTTASITDEASLTSSLGTGHVLEVEAIGTKPLLVTIGDSITMGRNGFVGYREHTASPSNPMGGDIRWQPGWNTARALDWGFIDDSKGSEDWTWAVTALSDVLAAKAPTHLVVQMGVNDLALGRTWAQVEADMDAFKALVDAHPTPIEMHISAIRPWTAGSSEQNATRREWNANYQAWAAASNCGFIAKDERLGQIRPSTGELDDLKTEYNLDGVHMTLAGQQEDGLVNAEHLGLDARSVRITCLDQDSDGTSNVGSTSPRRIKVSAPKGGATFQVSDTAGLLSASHLSGTIDNLTIDKSGASISGSIRTHIERKTGDGKLGYAELPP